MNAEEIRDEQEPVRSQLRDAFNFQKEGFSEPTQWTDGIGISRVKEFPDGFASLYKIGILPKEVVRESNIKTLSVSVNYGKSRA